jgi:MFS family permease
VARFSLVPRPGVAVVAAEVGTSREGSRPERARPHAGWLPFVGTAFVVVSLLASSNLPTPLYPVYGKAFGMSPLLIALVFATYALAVIPSLLFFGPLSDAVGRRKVFLAAVGLAIVSMALFAAAAGMVWLFAAQAVEGVALGALQGSAAPALVETDPSNNRRRASMVASAATVGGSALGPLLAGVLAQYGPLGRRLPFLVETGLLLAAVAIVLRAFADDVRRKTYRPRRPTVPNTIRSVFVLSAISSFIAWAVTALFLALIPSFAEEVIGTSNLAVPGAIVALMLGTAAAVQVVGQRLSSVSLSQQIAGLSLLVLGLVALIIAAQSKTVTPLLVGALLAGCGLGLAFMGALADVNDIAPEDRKGDIVASFYVVTYIGTAIPVIGVGVIAVAIGLLPAVQGFAYAAIAVSLLAIAAHIVEHRRRPSHKQS